ncbi:recombination protein NinB [Vreelandella venusta]|uniref:recombination protein NinB n=1 Tax=Vreelandella venusta TaxID=44935 RepID=UPI00200F326C|nr:recombination protein NinB [Halomonas venusta]UQI42730.1 recombination protein NinB [Halomonas venusta]
MGKPLTYTIRTLEDMQGALARMASAIGRGIERAPVEVSLRHHDGKRTLDQNRKLWPMLTDVSRQVQWPINGAMDYLPPEDWKDILTAGLDSEQRVAPGINGGFVMLGKRTSKMRKAEFAALIELIYAFGSQNDVQWSEPALAIYDEYREAAA